MKKIALLCILLLPFLTCCSLSEIFNQECKHENVQNSFNSVSHYVECVDCGEILSSEPHQFTGEWKVTKEPTHFYEGVEGNRCDVCHQSIGRDIPKTPHELVLHEYQAPTCYEEGCKEYYECSLCEELYYDEKATSLIIDLSNLKLSKLNHDYTSYEFIAPTTSENGSFRVICKHCRSGAINPQHLPNLQSSIYWSKTTIDPKCSENGSNTYIFNLEKYVSHSITDYTSRVLTRNQVIAIFEKAQEDGCFTITESIEKTGVHQCVFTVIENPTKTLDGKFEMVCRECNNIIANNNGELASVIPSVDVGGISGIQSSTVTCTDNGTVVVSIGWMKLFDLIHKNYTGILYDTPETIYVEYEQEAFGHNYNEYITLPTDINPGEAYVKCSRCNGYLSNTNNEKVIIPAFSDSAYYLECNTATCIADGIISYSVKDDSIHNLIKTELGLSDELVELYFAELLDIKKEYDSFAFGHLFTPESFIFISPTETEVGSLSYCCVNSNCQELMVFEDNTNSFEMPKIEHNENLYSKSSDNATCALNGVIYYSVNLSIFKDQMSAKLSEAIFNKYMTNEKLLETLDCFFALETPKKAHYHTAHSYIVEDGVLYNFCISCDADYVEFLVLPEFNETNYRIELVPGNCTSRKDSTNYMLFEEVVREIITSNKHVIRSEYSFDNCVNALSRRIFYSVEGDYNLNIHQSGTRTISATPATFNSATLVSTPGKLVLICNGCGATYTDEYSYHEAKWFKYFNGGNYYKVYANNCGNVFSREDVDKWQIVINTNGGKFDDINTIPSTCNIKDNFTISILEDYDLSYPGHKFSGFEVYIDGVKQELEYLKETGRYYTVEYKGGYLEHFFRVGLFENLDKEFIGDIYIKLLWE